MYGRFIRIIMFAVNWIVNSEYGSYYNISGFMP